MDSGLPPLVERAVRGMAERLRARFGERLLQVALYGSQARGQATGESDVDVFVRVAGLTEAERREVFDVAAEISIEHLVTLQAFAPSPAEHEWLERNECRILRDIATEGVPL